MTVTSARKTRRRKRHMLTDTDSRLLAVHVCGADFQNRKGGKGALKRSRPRFPFVQRVHADSGHVGPILQWAKDKTYIVLQIICRNAMTKHFEFCRGAGLSSRPSAGLQRRAASLATTSNHQRCFYSHHHRCLRQVRQELDVTKKHALSQID